MDTTTKIVPEDRVDEAERLDKTRRKGNALTPEELKELRRKAASRR